MMSAWTSTSSLRVLTLLLAAGLLAGCASSNQPAPRPVETGDMVRGGLQLREKPWRAPRSNLPDRLQLHDDEIRLPGAALNGRGQVRALVLPVAYDTAEHRWTDSVIAGEIFGNPRPSPMERAETTAGILAQASDGLFELDASIFPYLVQTERRKIDRPQEMNEQFAKAVLSSWAQRVDLLPFDNDGADGAPSSPDDDGVLDLVIFVAETDNEQAENRNGKMGAMELETKLPAGPKGDYSVVANKVHYLTVDRNQYPGGFDVRQSLKLVLGSMGLKEYEMFFPKSYEPTLSTLARLRLGWQHARFAHQSGHYAIQNGRTLVVPIVDVTDNRGLWLLERQGETLYMSRVARRSNGHFELVKLERMTIGQEPRAIPLASATGLDGPAMQISWPTGDDPLQVSIALSTDARNRVFSR